MKTAIIRIIVTREEDAFVAQCLEHDIAVQAPDIEALQRRFEDAIFFESESGGLDHIEPAPDAFFKMWNDAEAIPSTVENAEVRMAA